MSELTEEEKYKKFFRVLKSLRETKHAEIFSILDIGKEVISGVKLHDSQRVFKDLTDDQFKIMAANLSKNLSKREKNRSLNQQVKEEYSSLVTEQHIETIIDLYNRKDTSEHNLFDSINVRVDPEHSDIHVQILFTNGSKESEHLLPIAAMDYYTDYGYRKYLSHSFEQAIKKDLLGGDDNECN